MHETKWDPEFRIVEVIELRRDSETITCMIGTASADTKFVSVAHHRGEDVVDERITGIGPGISMADLVGQIEDNMRGTALQLGAQIEIVPIREPFDRKEFDEALERR